MLQTVIFTYHGQTDRTGVFVFYNKISNGHKKDEFSLLSCFVCRKNDISFLAHFLAPFVLVIPSFLLNSPDQVNVCVCG